MSVLELNDEQVISLVRQLPAARRRTALLALAQEAQVRREERLRFGEAQLRRACAGRAPGAVWIGTASPKLSAKHLWMACCMRNNRGDHRPFRYEHSRFRVPRSFHWNQKRPLERHHCFGQSQRDWIFQPRVARNELPWVTS